jgi:hypothetical protein
MNKLQAADNDFAHTVAWIDLSGSFRGRGIVSKANYSTGNTKKLLTNLDKHSPSIPSFFLGEISSTK